MGLHDRGRDERGRFLKGKSGNPGGRPRRQVQPLGDLDFRLARELVRQIEWDRRRRYPPQGHAPRVDRRTHH